MKAMSFKLRLLSAVTMITYCLSAQASESCKKMFEHGLILISDEGFATTTTYATSRSSLINADVMTSIIRKVRNDLSSVLRFPSSLGIRIVSYYDFIQAEYGNRPRLLIPFVYPPPAERQNLELTHEQGRQFAEAASIHEFMHLGLHETLTHESKAYKQLIEVYAASLKYEKLKARLERVKKISSEDNLKKTNLVQRLENDVSKSLEKANSLDKQFEKVYGKTAMQALEDIQHLHEFFADAATVIYLGSPDIFRNMMMATQLFEDPDHPFIISRSFVIPRNVEYATMGDTPHETYGVSRSFFGRYLKGNLSLEEKKKKIEILLNAVKPLLLKSMQDINFARHSAAELNQELMDSIKINFLTLSGETHD